MTRTPAILLLLAALAISGCMMAPPPEDMGWHPNAAGDRGGGGH